MTYKRFDVVVVPFPFTDQQSEKRRPALVLSDAECFNDPTENCVLAMITSAKNHDWPACPVQGADENFHIGQATYHKKDRCAVG